MINWILHHILIAIAIYCVIYIWHNRKAVNKIFRSMIGVEVHPDRSEEYDPEWMDKEAWKEDRW